MTVDCQWIEKHLEALFCDGLSEQEKSLAEEHIENCAACQQEVQALRAIDPLVKRHFHKELSIASRPRVANTARVFGLSGAAVALVAILLFVVLRAPQTNNPGFAPAPVAPQTASVPPATEVPPPVKEDPNAANRAKPVAGDRAVAPNVPVTPAIAANAPDFMVTDPAGYSHTTDEYRGKVVVIGVWSPDQAEAVANFERLYQSHATNTKFRFLGVTNQRVAKPGHVTFPILYNQGSKLFGAQSGDFVLLDEKGGIELRGSLVKDFDTLRKLLQSK